VVKEDENDSTEMAFLDGEDCRLDQNTDQTTEYKLLECKRSDDNSGGGVGRDARGPYRGGGGGGGGGDNADGEDSSTNSPGREKMR
jgi:hypothetical protein